MKSRSLLLLCSKLFPFFASIQEVTLFPQTHYNLLHILQQLASLFVVLFWILLNQLIWLGFRKEVSQSTHLAEVNEEGAGGPVHAVVGVAGVWAPHLLHPLRKRRERQHAYPDLTHTFLSFSKIKMSRLMLLLEERQSLLTDYSLRIHQQPVCRF